jgi:hypothetical protein
MADPDLPRRPRDDDFDDEDDRPRRRRRRYEDDEPDDGVSALIPYRNPRALTAYYLGFGGLLPVLSVVLAPAAIILGFMGIGYANRNPRAKGLGHAVTGVVLGFIGFFLCNPVWGVLIWVAFVAGPR